MENNTEKNSMNISDGIVAIIGFIFMAFLIFWLAFYMGREIGRNDRTDLENYMEKLEVDKNEMGNSLKNIEEQLQNIEFKVDELDVKVDKMQAASPEEKEEEAGDIKEENGNEDVVNQE